MAGDIRDSFSGKDGIRVERFLGEVERPPMELERPNLEGGGAEGEGKDEEAWDFSFLVGLWTWARESEASVGGKVDIRGLVM
jgi:hypothetical protein